ncbi:MAG: hypothetical protein ACOYKM_10165 [Caulobacterales bacterium]|jgi:hypothetical protein
MTDALSWLERRTRKTSTRTWLTFLFALPLLKGLVNRTLEGGRSFADDFEAVLCAGRNALAGAVYYGEAGTCADISHTPYVYLPWVAEGAGRAIGVLGETGFQLAYAVIYAALAAFMLFCVFVSRLAPGRFAERILFLGLITGSALALGNVAIPLHALILGGALLVTTSVLPLALAIGLAGAVKPLLLTFGVVFLLAPISWPRKILGGVAALAIALPPWVLSLQAGGPQIDAWLAVTREMAVDVAPGDGFWGWLALFGVPGTEPTAIVAYLVFALALVGCGWAVAANGGLSARERVWLGLAVGVLIIPRLMAIDVFLLAPGLLALLVAARDRATSSFQTASWLVVGGAALGLLLDLVDAGDYAVKIALLAFCLAIVWVGVRLLPKSG